MPRRFRGAEVETTFEPPADESIFAKSASLTEGLGEIAVFIRSSSCVSFLDLSRKSFRSAGYRTRFLLYIQDGSWQSAHQAAMPSSIPDDMYSSTFTLLLTNFLILSWQGASWSSQCLTEDQTPLIFPTAYTLSSNAAQ
jgi:hypothetical protein